MSFSGTFVNSTNENFEAWLKAVGASDEQVKKIAASKPKLEISEVEAGLAVKITSGDIVLDNKINFGSQSQASLGNIKYTMNVNKTGNGYSGSMHIGSKTGNISAEFTEAALIRTLTIDGVTAKRVFARQ